MTDKKYTDEEIVKALRSWISSHDCDIICTKEQMNCDWCLVELLKQTLFLINRQKAEIEDWKAENVWLRDEIKARRTYQKLCETARAEAIKEFAERLRASCDAPHWCVWLSEIDQIEKELMEGRKRAKKSRLRRWPKSSERCASQVYWTSATVKTVTSAWLRRFTTLDTAGRERGSG